MDRRRALTGSHGRTRGNCSSRYRRGVSMWLSSPAGTLLSIARNRRLAVSGLAEAIRLVAGQISFQCPHRSRERGIGFDESSPAIVENQVGQTTNFFHMTALKVRIHMFQHADRIAARVSSVAIGGKPIVKTVGNRPQQWQG